MSRIFIGALAIVCCSVSAANEVGDLCDVVSRLAKNFIDHPLFYLLPDIYGGAIDFMGLFETHEAFRRCSTWPQKALPEMSLLLNTYEKLPFTSAWIELRNRSVTAWGDTIGDTRGLFPIVYLERAEYYRRHPEDAPESYNSAQDMAIALGGLQDFVLNFPQKLPDGTLARHSGGTAWPMAKDPTYIWADDQFMGLALLTRVAEVTLEQRWIDHFSEMVVQQLGLFEKHLLDPVDGLFAHGFRWDGHAGERSCCKWGRANGWGLMARAQALQAFDSFAAANLSVAGGAGMLEAFKSHAMAMLVVQSAEDGRWHQVLNETGTYLESSATAMTVFAFARGVARGWLPESLFAAAANRGWNALTKQVSAGGRVKGICIPTDILGSSDDYAQRPTFPFLSIEGGVGAVVRAAVAMAELQTMDTSTLLV